MGNMPLKTSSPRLFGVELGGRFTPAFGNNIGYLKRFNPDRMLYWYKDTNDFSEKLFREHPEDWYVNVNEKVSRMFAKIIP